MKPRILLICLPFLLGACTTISKLTDRAEGDRAFIAYFPPPKGDTRLKLAVKDNIDMQGLVTTAGSEYRLKNSPPARRDDVRIDEEVAGEVPREHEGRDHGVESG